MFREYEKIKIENSQKVIILEGDAVGRLKKWASGRTHDRSPPK